MFLEIVVYREDLRFLDELSLRIESWLSFVLVLVPLIGVGQVELRRLISFPGHLSLLLDPPVFMPFTYLAFFEHNYFFVLLYEIGLKRLLRCAVGPYFLNVWLNLLVRFSGFVNIHGL